MNTLLEPLLKELKNLPTLKGVYLFGSFASQQQTAHSDIDLALLFEAPLNTAVLFQLKSNLQTSTDRDLDLIDLHTVDILFQNEIICRGKRILTLDKPFCIEFEVNVFMLYVDFSYYRAPILADIKNRGHIRGSRQCFK